MDRALEWEYGPRGLLLYGPTGAGKSRIAWEVCKREILDGRAFRCLTALSLSRYPSLLMAGDDAAGKFADELCRVKLLLLDDVFKAKATERVEELIFNVVDERMEWELPVIVTINDSGSTLETRLSADRGPALLRRMRESCFTIRCSS